MNPNRQRSTFHRSRSLLAVAPADLGTILSVWAHPDDETYLAAGVMSAAADRGRRVVCVSVTAGERGTADPDTWPPLRLRRRRTWEAAAAMAVLGVADHRILGFPDGALAEQDEDGLAAIGTVLGRATPASKLTLDTSGWLRSDGNTVR
jgi:LmbE family N-acetylglucosaminyl deacetylase